MSKFFVFIEFINYNTITNNYKLLPKCINTKFVCSFTTLYKLCMWDREQDGQEVGKPIEHSRFIQ